MTCTVVRPTTEEFKKKQEIADHSSQSITSSTDIKMNNWTAAEIQEMQRLLGLCSCLVVLACCCSGKLRTVVSFKLKVPC